MHVCYCAVSIYMYVGMYVCSYVCIYACICLTNSAFLYFFPRYLFFSAFQQQEEQTCGLSRKRKRSANMVHMATYGNGDPDPKCPKKKLSDELRIQRNSRVNELRTGALARAYSHKRKDRLLCQSVMTTYKQGVGDSSFVTPEYRKKSKSVLVEDNSFSPSIYSSRTPVRDFDV